MALTPKKAQEAESAIQKSIARISHSDEMLHGTLARIMSQAEATVDFAADLGILDEIALEKPIDASGENYETCVGRFLTSLGIDGDIDDIQDIRNYTRNTMLREIKSRQRYLDAMAPRARVPLLVETLEVKAVTPKEEWKLSGKPPAGYADRSDKGASFITFMLNDDFWLKNIYTAIKAEGGLPLAIISTVDRQLYDAFNSRRKMKTRSSPWEGFDHLRGLKINRESMLSLIINEAERELVKTMLVEQFDPGGTETIFDFLPRALKTEAKRGKIEFKGGPLYAGDLHKQNKPAFLALFNIWHASLDNLHVYKQTKTLSESMTAFMDTSVSYEQLMAWKSQGLIVARSHHARKPPMGPRG